MGVDSGGDDSLDLDEEGAEEEDVVGLGSRGNFRTNTPTVGIDATANGGVGIFAAEDVAVVHVPPLPPLTQQSTVDLQQQQLLCAAAAVISAAAGGSAAAAASNKEESSEEHRVLFLSRKDREISL